MEGEGTDDGDEPQQGGGGNSSKNKGPGTLLDGDFLEFTAGRPMPMHDRAKAVFHMSILNDTLFLSIINVLDYSILVGIDEEKMELVVGIIDFMRQYDILKQMERVGKSLPMVVGSEAPTIIQPPLYKARFTNAMERYFMTVPSKWTTI
jgi:1-phosphatidylinositol-3-phosphate 5-kinase